MPSYRTVALLLTLPLAALHYACVNASEVSGEFNCSAQNATANLAALPNGGSCLSYLEQNPAAFEPCRNTTCYLFLQEEPFIIFDTNVFNDTPEALPLQEPFPCGQPRSRHSSLRGISLEVHALTSSRDHLCAWAGPTAACTFNELVDYVDVKAADGFRFAITGLLLETPQRQCNHDPSAPLIDNSMIIIGENTGPSASTKGPLFQLTQPFRWQAWAIFIGTVLLFITVAFSIAIRFRVFRGRSLLTAFFIFTGEREEALAYEQGLNRKRDSAPRSASKKGVSLNEGEAPVHMESWQSSTDHLNGHQSNAYAGFGSDSYATKYGLSMTLFRIALVAFLAIFALFYEVAVVNFLFQQQTLQLGKRVRNLSVQELNQYSILKNSALEDIWNSTVNRRGLKFDGTDDSTIPWQRCNTGVECIIWAADPNNNVKFDVTFEIVGKFLLKENSNCKSLTIFETQDVLYQFNAGWLYSSAVDPEVRKQIDRELIALRISGTIRELVDAEVGEFECTEDIQTDIGPLIILIPCGLFVLPPLLCSVLVLFLWKKTIHPDRVADPSPTDIDDNNNPRDDDQNAIQNKGTFEYVEEAEGPSTSTSAWV